ncbi:HAD-IC family P-type ATPase [Lactococcus cremoris]|uniref:HAD-IC family P-type ATPase n=1 Tax=Lactococcus lactis subsp. cremoris TaxID=1359 RepID=UPI000583E30C|nr:HAD-IC family P-type ATPase [Lactococcus cremoris]KGH34437.1 metal ABC transporter ATPase [Lactococcus cremoris]QSE64537.1 HAD-IC family P-type ATPase [Lactococcus cremoris]
MDKVNMTKGLTNTEVEEQKKLGNVNVTTIKVGNSNKDIIIKNSMTIFNLLNLILAVVLFVIGSYKNMLFIFSIISNTSIGIYQEIKAKRIIEKLSFLKQEKVEVIREGEKASIHKEELVLNDIICLKKGDQVPVDAISLGNGMDVDESMITGESDFIEKQTGDFIYSGSLVMQGTAKAKVQAVGNHTFISKLAKEASVLKKAKSKIQQQIDKILKIIVIGIIPISILVLLNQFVFSSLDLSVIPQRKTAIIGTAATITSLIPEGLVLLTSVALALGVIKLSRMNVLTQELSAIETLARVDVLCLDKTGTITEGQMNVEQVLYYAEEKPEVDKIMSFIISLDEEQNASMEALKKYFDTSQKSNFELETYHPFSSETKYQSIELNGGSTYNLGAFDLVAKELTTKQNADIEKALEEGYRILALSQSKPNEKDSLVCLILLKDRPKKEAKRILEYFEKQGTKIKIISGDHPKTVSLIAKEVGLEADYVGLSELPDDEKEFKKIVEEKTIFGRITPERKRDIIASLQSNGHTVGMIGDGINDILALKKSDCPIALGSGNEATTSVAQFILLKNDFSVLPDILKEGRKVINNITRVASMNLLRVIYTFTLTVLLLITHHLFPLESINLMMMGIFTVGIPSALLVLEKDEKRNEEDILQKIRNNALPTGIIIGVAIFAMLALAYKFPIYTSFTNGHVVTHYKEFISDVTLIIGSVQLFSLYLLCRPLSRFRAIVITGMTALFYGTYFIEPVTKFLGIAPFTSFRFLIPTSICILLILIIRAFFSKEVKMRSKKLILLISCLLLVSGFSFTKLRQYSVRAMTDSPQYKKILVNNWEKSQLNKENTNEK